MAILEVKNLNFKYNTTDKYALENINFSVNKGEFIVICGASGCGKSTLLKLIKKQLSPKGQKSGQVLYNGTEILSLDDKTAVSDIGYVMQNPDNQIVTDKVWHELSFSLESLGYDNKTISKKIAEICGFFGITDWFLKDTATLSGGQKQLVNLASIMLLEPQILILDEPTSQLDPIMATQFLNTILKLNSELGLTILLVEHRLEEVFSMCDKVLVMDKAKIYDFDSPRKIGEKLSTSKNSDSHHKMELGLPSSVRLYNNFNFTTPCPLNVKEGKNFIKDNFIKNDTQLTNSKTDNNSKTATHKINNQNSTITKLNDNTSNTVSNKDDNIALELKNACFRYERNLPDVISNLDLEVLKNELLFILGDNGSGKTTLLKILAGVRKIYSGKFRIWGKKRKDYSGASLYRGNIALLPQNPQNVFVKSTVKEDLQEVTKLLNLKKDDSEEIINKMANDLEITHLLQSHPYDLSGGEQQKAALAKILLLDPSIILLDEPTKSLDSYSKTVLAKILAMLKQNGKTLVIVSHDIEFAALYADRCAMLFNGQIVSDNTPIEFFSGNTFYTTSAYRMSREFFNSCVTIEQLTKKLQQKI